MTPEQKVKLKKEIIGLIKTYKCFTETSRQLKKLDKVFSIIDNIPEVKT